MPVGVIDVPLLNSVYFVTQTLVPTNDGMSLCLTLNTHINLLVSFFIYNFGLTDYRTKIIYSPTKMKTMRTTICFCPPLPILTSKLICYCSINGKKLYIPELIST